MCNYYEGPWTICNREGRKDCRPASDLTRIPCETGNHCTQTAANTKKAIDLERRCAKHQSEHEKAVRDAARDAMAGNLSSQR